MVVAAQSAGKTFACNNGFAAVHARDPLPYRFRKARLTRQTKLRVQHHSCHPCNAARGSRVQTNCRPAPKRVTGSAVVTGAAPE